MLALSMTLLSSRHAEAQSKCLVNWPRDGFNLAGRLDDGDIRAYLDLGYPAQAVDGVSGVFIYPSRWQPGQSDAVAEFSLDGGAGDEAGEIEMTTGVACREQVKRGAEVDDEGCLLRGQLAAAQRRRHLFAPPDVLASEGAQCLSRRRRRQLPAPKRRAVSRHRCARRSGG